MVFLFDTTRKGSNMNAAGHSTRYRPEYREPVHDCCLPGASILELAEFLGVALRAIDNSIATPRAHRALQYHPWYFALLPTLYTGTKELSYPACRRLAAAHAHPRTADQLQARIRRARHPGLHVLTAYASSSGTTQSAGSPRATRWTLSKPLRRRVTLLSKVGPAR